jgi:hypothetical protein
MVKSYSSIDSTTIIFFQDEFLEAIEWYEKLPDKDKEPIFTADRYKILSELKRLVQETLPVKGRYDDHLTIIAKEYQEYLRKELNSHSEKLPIETKNKMKKTIQRITDFLEGDYHPSPP